LAHYRVQCKQWSFVTICIVAFTV